MAYGAGVFVSSGWSPNMQYIEPSALKAAVDPQWHYLSANLLRSCSLMFCHDRFFGVDDVLNIRTSLDGKVWNPTVKMVANGVASNAKFAHLGGKFFFPTTGGRVLASSDGGVKWSAVSVGVTTVTLNDICQVGGYLIAVGNSGTVIRSPEGASWELMVSDPTLGHLVTITETAQGFFALSSTGKTLSYRAA